MISKFPTSLPGATPSNYPTDCAQITKSSIELTELWLRRVYAYRLGTYDSVACLQELRERVSIIPQDLHDCIQPVVDVLDDIFSSNRLSSSELEPAVEESFQRLNELKSISLVR